MPQRTIVDLYDEYMDPVYRYVVYSVRHAQLAEDIVSETFIKVMKNRDQFEERQGASIQSWIYAIARNTMIDMLRMQQRNPAIDLHDVEIPVVPSQIDDVDFSIQLKTVLRALDALPPSQRECLYLRVHADLKNHEIAEMLGITERTVAAHISRGMKELKKMLSEQI